MSTDTMAWFDLAAPLDAFALGDQLAKEPVLAALVPRFGPAWQPQVWSVEDDGYIVGPGGLAIRLRARVANAYHVLRFSAFAAGGADHDLVRRAYHAIARCLGTDRAVITHELAATGDGDGLDGVIAALTANAGPPAATYRELAEADYYAPRSWIVETFADL